MTSPSEERLRALLHRERNEGDRLAVKCDVFYFALHRIIRCAENEGPAAPARIARDALDQFEDQPEPLRVHSDDTEDRAAPAAPPALPATETKP